MVRLLVLTALTMTAFAANSVLNRLAVGHVGMSAEGFAVVRTLSGAVAMAALVLLRGGRLPLRPWPGRLAGAAALAVYLIGFSLAYGRLDAGIGALILFGAVQLTMFGGALGGGEVVPPWRWRGAAVSLAGLGVLVLAGDGSGALSAPHVVSMALAGVGWGVYSLRGRRAADPMATTAANFVVAVPLVLPLLCIAPMPTEPRGLALAVTSGAVMSGLGYTMWYAIVPQLGATRAAVAQLSAPVIAAIGGVLLLGEPVRARLLLATPLVLGGIALSLLPSARTTPAP